MINNGNVFNKNLKALKEYYPELAKKVQQISESDKYELITSENRFYNIYIKEKNNYYYDYYNPIDDVAKQISQLKLKNTRLAVLLGLGLGYEAIFYLSGVAKSQNTSYMVIIEKDIQLFSLALKITDLVDLIKNPKIMLIVGVEQEELFSVFFEHFKQTALLILIKTLKPVYHISSIKINKEYYLNALKIMKEAAVFARRYYGNSPQDSLLGIKNMFENINEIIGNPGINLLQNKFKNKPAVVVSTGPSLNKNKHLLKGLEDKAVIIAADSALKILLEMGVIPHLVTMLERTLGPHRFLEGLDEELVKDVYFAGSPVIDNKSYEVYSGPRVIVYRNLAHFKWLGIDRGMLDIKLSAGNMSFKIAEALGCNPIILIGQDLAYGKTGNTHATGMVLGEKREAEEKFKKMMVKGNDGSMLQTHESWYRFLQSYEIDIANYDGICINSTEGGAYINGTQVMPLQSAIDNYIKEKFDPLAMIKQNLSKFDKEETFNDANKVLDLINNTIADIKYIVESCNEGLILHENNKNELSKYVKEYSKLDNGTINRIKSLKELIISPKIKIQTEIKDTFELLFMHVIQSFYLDFEIEIATVPNEYNDPYKALSDQILRHDKWYSTIKEIALVVLDLLYKSESNVCEYIKDKL